MDTARLHNLLPVALGHDQTASRCPWVQLTRSTADYPSRKAQAAIALLAGAIPASESLADLMFRCEGCNRCLPADVRRGAAYSELIFDARAMLVLSGAVRPASNWEANWRQFGNVQGDITDAALLFQSANREGSILFLPGAASIVLDLATARATWRLIQRIAPSAVVDTGILDSVFTLRELGLASIWEAETARIRDRIARAGYETIIAGTPKEAFGLSMALEGLPVTVTTVAEMLSNQMTTGLITARPNDRPGLFLLHLADHAMRNPELVDHLDRALAGWLGDAFERSEDCLQWWPAAIERPSTPGNRLLHRRLAQVRSDQLLARAGSRPLTILTVDPFSHEALTKAVHGRARVAGLASIVESCLESTNGNA